jgi:carbonic anhydrase
MSDPSGGIPSEKDMRTHTQATQSELTPELALEILQQGNLRFMKNMQAHRDLLEQVNATSDGQFPFAAILSCIDSRTSAELIFDQGLGDIFSIRVAGNILNDDILGSMEFSCKLAGSKLIVVLGHTKCGAITGACNNVKLGHVTAMLQKVAPAIAKETETTDDRTGANAKYVRNVTKINVDLTVEQVRRQSPILAEMERAGEIKIVGGLYDVESGHVSFMLDGAEQA